MVGGRGAGDKKQFEILYKLADKLGAAGMYYFCSVVCSGRYESSGGSGNDRTEFASWTNRENHSTFVIRGMWSKRIDSAPSRNERVADDCVY